MAKIVYFTPFSGIWEHAFPQALTGEALRQSGHEILFIGCDGLFKEDYCPVMETHALSVSSSTREKESKACKSCSRNSAFLRKQFGFGGYEIGDLLSDTDRQEADRLFRTVTRENFFDFEIDGLPIGKLSLCETLLKFKKLDLSFTEEQWNHYRAYLRTGFFSYFAARKMLAKEKPDVLVMYTRAYTINALWAAAAEAKGVIVYNLHAGTNAAHRLGTLFFGVKQALSYMKQIIEFWPKFRNQPIDPQTLSKVTDHLLDLLSAKTFLAYSPVKTGQGFSLRKHFGVKPDQKVLVATLSSNDERFVSELMGWVPPPRQPVFPNQVEWLKLLLEECRNRPEWFLIIRVHPREFPNHREGQRSEHANVLMELLKDIPDNVKVNWPNDNISLYDLADETDVFLNAWSSVGKEMGMLGIPVVIYSPDLIFYPHDINLLGNDRADYLAKIEKALEEGWSPDRARYVYRWLALEQFKSLIDISESYSPENRARSNRLLARVFRKVDRVLFPMRRERQFVSRRASELRAKPILDRLVAQKRQLPFDFQSELPGSVKLEDETAALKCEFRRIYAGLYGSDSRPEKEGTLQWNIYRFSS